MTGSPDSAPTPRSPARRPGAAVPGLTVCLALGVASVLAATALRPWAPALSPLLLAILAGVAWRNLAPVPARLEPGIAVSAKPVLRAGIVLLGLQLLLSDVLALGWGAVGLVVGVVALTFAATLALGRALHLPWDLTALVASGFSICGAAAVAAADGVVRARREMAATAIGLVVLFGTLMIPLLPALAGALGLGERTAGLWIGASTHEVAQVVAAGGLVGGAALSVAVTVKLARVVMLAPVMAALAWAQRRRDAADPHADGATGAGARPPLVPWFVVGFLAAVLLRATGWLPGGVLDAAAVLQQVLLAAAMAALGLGVRLRSIAAVGPRPLVLGAGSTAVALAAGGAGAALLG
ncbi:YeiH family protein [Micrococcus porci]|uniref:YeiH family protein n=1 Tax=Micrococcus porci TaxID=2856555 RepID=UPI003CF74850